jgi:hypothetical protein
VLEVGGERVVLDRGGGGPVRLAQDSAASLALLERTAEVEPHAVVTVTAPTGPGEAAAERFSLRGFRDARDAARRECTQPMKGADSLVIDGGLVRFGTGWNVHAVPTGEPGRRTCFAAARQLVSRSWPSSGPLPDPAGPRLVVARREASQGVSPLAYDPGHAYADGAEAVLQVGEQRFRMPVREGMAEARESAAAVQAMLGADPAGTVTVTGPGDGGTEVVSRFSLDGFRRTYDAAATYCNEPS